MIELAEIVVVVISVIGLVWCGVYIGKTYGTFEDFIIAFFDRIKENWRH